MTNDEAFKVIFAVLGVSHLAMAGLVWSRRDRWEGIRKKWGGWRARYTGQPEINTLLSLGVLFIGLAIFLP